MLVRQAKATNRARRFATAKELPGRNTLFEYACSLESNLSKVAEEIGVNSTRLSLDAVDLLYPQHVEQLHGQVSEVFRMD